MPCPRGWTKKMCERRDTLAKRIESRVPAARPGHNDSPTPKGRAIAIATAALKRSRRSRS